MKCHCTRHPITTTTAAHLCSKEAQSLENNPSAWTPASLDQYRDQMIEGPAHGLHVHPDTSRASRHPPAGLGRCSKLSEGCLPDLALWLDFLRTRETRRENGHLASSRDGNANGKMGRDKTDSCPHLLSQPLLSDAGQSRTAIGQHLHSAPQD